MVRADKLMSSFLPLVAFSSKPKDPSKVLTEERAEPKRRRGKGRKKGKGKKRNPCLKKYKDFCIHGTCQYLATIRNPSCVWVFFTCTSVSPLFLHISFVTDLLHSPWIDLVSVSDFSMSDTIKVSEILLTCSSRTTPFWCSACMHWVECCLLLFKTERTKNHQQNH